MNWEKLTSDLTGDMNRDIILYAQYFLPARRKKFEEKLINAKEHSPELALKIDVLEEEFSYLNQFISEVREKKRESDLVNQTQWRIELIRMFKDKEIVSAPVYEHNIGLPLSKKDIYNRKAEFLKLLDPFPHAHIICVTRLSDNEIFQAGDKVSIDGDLKTIEYFFIAHYSEDMRVLVDGGNYLLNCIQKIKE